MSHSAARCVTSRPTLARTRVRRVPIRTQRSTVDPSVRNSVDNLLAGSAEHGRHNGRRGNAHEDHVIQPHAIEAVLKCEHALDLVRLDHPGEYVAYLRRRLT